MISKNENTLNSGLMFLLTIATGLCVSTLYYAQPMLGTIRDHFNSSIELTSSIISFTQVGYAIGLFFLAPLSDRYDRKRIISIKLLALVVSLLFGFFAPSIHGLIIASFFIGLFATAAQDYIPAVAILSPESTRGKNLGVVMTGLLLGILLSRVASGAISEAFGWRTVYLVGTVSIFILFFFTRKFLPKFQPTIGASYQGLMMSLFSLMKRFPQLRTVTLAQGLLSAAFSAFWSTLAIMLYDRYGLGPMAAGSFGLAGAAGTLAAPIAGTLSDKLGPNQISRIGSTIATLSFASLFFIEAISVQYQVALLVACAVGFDFGVQATLISHQTIMYGLEANSRSRLNAVFSTGIFIGMANGAILGGLAYGRFGILGFAVFVTVVCGLATVLRLLTGRTSPNVSIAQGA